MEHVHGVHPRLPCPPAWSANTCAPWFEPAGQQPARMIPASQPPPSPSRAAPQRTAWARRRAGTRAGTAAPLGCPPRSRCRRPKRGRCTRSLHSMGRDGRMGGWGMAARGCHRQGAAAVGQVNKPLRAAPPAPRTDGMICAAALPSHPPVQYMTQSTPGMRVPSSSVTEPSACSSARFAALRMPAAIAAAMPGGTEPPAAAAAAAAAAALEARARLLGSTTSPVSGFSHTRAHRMTLHQQGASGTTQRLQEACSMLSWAA